MTHINLHEEMEQKETHGFELKYTTFYISPKGMLDDVYIAVRHDDVEKARPLLEDVIKNKKEYCNWFFGASSKKLLKAAIDALTKSGLKDFRGWVEFFVGY